MAISRKPDGVRSLIAEMDKAGTLGCTDISYNNYIIREWPPLVPGGTSHCFVLNPKIYDRDRRGIAFYRTVDDCMEYIDKLNTQDGVVWDTPSPHSMTGMPLYLTGREMFRKRRR